MFRKSLFVLFLLLSVGAIFAQQSEISAVRSFDFVFAEESGYLGVQTEEITRENFSKFNLSKVQGVAVEKVLENSPAARAGLAAGDVILKFGGEEVTGTRKLMRLIGEVAPDHQVVLTISRGGSEREISVTLGKRPMMPVLENGRFGAGILLPNGQFPQLPPMTGGPQMRRFPVPGQEELPGVPMRRFGGRQIGITAVSMTKQLSDYLGIDETKGLFVTEVLENSPAARAGLKTGDVIVEAEDREMKTTADLLRAINEKKEGDIGLTIIRDKTRQTVRVLPEASRENFRQFDNFARPADLPPMN